QQLVVNGVNWNGTTQQNVLLMAGEIDLSDFGLLAGASVNDPFNINLRANSTTIPMALSLVGALHTGAATTAVPVPAPFALLFSGLAALGLIARRK
ncbi:MAG: hypothetical protein QG652_674, partial [Pseudomonadota bacterium]|nr:hypothetical protein [Pseudomonadota bacterium]